MKEDRSKSKYTSHRSTEGKRSRSQFIFCILFSDSSNNRLLRFHPRNTSSTSPSVPLLRALTQTQRLLQYQRRQGTVDGEHYPLKGAEVKRAAHSKGCNAIVSRTMRRCGPRHAIVLRKRISQSPHALSEAEEDIRYLHNSVPCLNGALLELMFWIELLKNIVGGKRLLEKTFNDWLETAPHLVISCADRYARLVEFWRMLIFQPKWRCGGILRFSRE